MLFTVFIQRIIYFFCRFLQKKEKKKNLIFEDIVQEYFCNTNIVFGH